MQTQIINNQHATQSIQEIFSSPNSVMMNDVLKDLIRDLLEKHEKPSFLQRLSCKNLLEKRIARLTKDLEGSAKVRKTALEFIGRLLSKEIASF